MGHPHPGESPAMGGYIYPANNSFPCFSHLYLFPFQDQSKCLGVQWRETLYLSTLFKFCSFWRIYLTLYAPLPPHQGHAGLGIIFWGVTMGPGCVSRTGRGCDTQPLCPRAEPGSAARCGSPLVCGMPLPGSLALQGSGSGSIAGKQPRPAEHLCHLPDPFAVPAVHWRGP